LAPGAALDETDIARRFSVVGVPRCARRCGNSRQAAWSMRARIVVRVARPSLDRLTGCSRQWPNSEALCAGLAADGCRPRIASAGGDS